MVRKSGVTKKRKKEKKRETANKRKWKWHTTIVIDCNMHLKLHGFHWIFQHYSQFDLFSNILWKMPPCYIVPTWCHLTSSTCKLRTRPESTTSLTMKREAKKSCSSRYCASCQLKKLGKEIAQPEWIAWVSIYITMPVTKTRTEVWIQMTNRRWIVEMLGQPSRTCLLASVFIFWV